MLSAGVHKTCMVEKAIPSWPKPPKHTTSTRQLRSIQHARTKLGLPRGLSIVEVLGIVGDDQDLSSASSLSGNAVEGRYPHMMFSLLGTCSCPRRLGLSHTTFDFRIEGPQRFS
jgi:hypothetical protein